jgi:hypothetical protein
MMRAEVVRDVDGQWWDSLVRSAQGEFHQSMAYSSFCCECFRKRPYYLIVEENGTPSGIASFFLEGYGQDFFTAKFPLPLSTLPVGLLRSVWKCCSLIHGPLIFDRDREADVLKRLLEEIEQFARAENIFWWKKVMPPLHDQSYTRALWDHVFAHAGFEQSAWATFLVDLTEDEETLWKRLKHSARKTIKKVGKQGVSFRQVTDEAGFRKYYTLFAETRARKGLPMGIRYDLLKQWWRQHQDVFHIFLAEQEGIPLAGQGVFHFHHIMREVFAGTSDYAVEHKLYGGDFLKFEVLKWGKQHGYHLYDLAGVHPNPPTPAEKNIRQFKEKWGGQYVEFSVYHKLYNPRPQQVLHGVKACRNHLRRLFR